MLESDQRRLGRIVYWTADIFERPHQLPWWAIRGRDAQEPYIASGRVKRVAGVFAVSFDIHTQRGGCEPRKSAKIRRASCRSTIGCIAI
jgi:hypothetical protein